MPRLGQECRIEIIKTTGDKITDVPLSTVGGKGLFTKEIEEALLDRRADLAVHSLKDLPTELPNGLAIAAIPEREDPRDASCRRSNLARSEAGREGRHQFAAAARNCAVCGPDLGIESIRGNVDTRFASWMKANTTPIVLAAAGLRRLGWDTRMAETSIRRRCARAVGQGALAIETRERSGRRLACVALDDHIATRTAVTAERAFRARLGGGCQVPIGAYATVDYRRCITSGRRWWSRPMVRESGRRAHKPADRAEDAG